MTAGFGIPVASLFEAVDPDELARTYRGAVRQTISAASIAQLVAELNVLAARCPRINFAKLIPAAAAGGTGWLWRWCWPDVVQNASQHEFRALCSLRAVDPATGNAYWLRLDDSMADDTDVEGAEHTGYDPGWFSWRRYFEERATFTRTGATRAPTDSVQEEGIRNANGGLVGGLVVQDVPLRSLDIADHKYVAIPPRAGDPIIGGGVMEALRLVLHEIRTTNLPIVVSWCANGSGATFATSTADNAGDENGICIADDTTYRNVLYPTVSATYGWETYSATTPGFIAHVYRCGVGDPSTAAGGKIKINCYVLALATVDDATVRFEGPSSIASNTTEITVTVAGGLAWYGGTSNSIYLDTTVANNNATTSRAKIDVCGVAGTGGKVRIYGLFAHVTYA